MAWKLRKDKLKADTPDTSEEDADAPEVTSPAAIAAPPPPETATESGGVQAVDDAKPLFPPRPLPTFSDEAEHAMPEPEAAEEPDFSDEPTFLDQPAIAMGGGEPISPGALEPTSVDAPAPEPLADSTPELEPLPGGDRETETAKPDAAEPEPITLGAFTPYQPPAPVAPPVLDEPERDEPEFEEPTFDEPTFDEPEHDPIPLTPTAPEPKPVIPPPPAPEPIAPMTDAVVPPPPSEEEPAPAPKEPLPDPNREAVAPGLVTTDTESGLPRVAPFVLDGPAPSAPVHAMPSVVLRLGNLSATYFLVKAVTTIGRPDSAVQNYPDIEVELDDGVSRQHAEIRRQDDGFALVDVGSTNGTILNGQMLAAEQPAPLRPGDRIRIGERTEILFE